MAGRSLLVCTHGHCFDGLASAALFSRLHGHVVGPGFERRYRSCGYGPGMAQIPASWLRGTENAILDFRFTDSPRVDWYFDHHATAFGDGEERDRALAPPTAGRGRRRYWDPTYGSCAKLVDDVARKHFDLDLELPELVAWADRIDSARFASAEEATDVTAPAMRLAAIVEQHGDGPFLERFVPRLGERTLAEVAAMPDADELWRPIAAGRDAYARRVAARGERLGDVVLVDLADEVLGAAPKFVTYALFPDCTYSVAVLRTRQLTKVGIGYNPWCGRPRRHDVSAICRREGGGGHPAVGAFSLGPDEADRARAIARRIARELAEAGIRPESA